MELEKLVLAELRQSEMHGIQIINLDINSKSVHVTFEIGQVTVHYTTESENQNQLDAVVMTSTNEPCQDQDAIDRIYDWVKYISSILHPIIQKHRLDFEELITPAVALPGEQDVATNAAVSSTNIHKVETEDLEKLVLAQLRQAELHGIQVNTLTFKSNSVLVVFELGQVTIHYTTENEEQNQLDAVIMTSTNEPCEDKEAIDRIHDWIKFISSVLHPIIREHQAEYTTTQSSEDANSRVNLTGMIVTDSTPITTQSNEFEYTTPVTTIESHLSAANFHINELGRILSVTEQQLVGVRQELVVASQELADVKQNESPLKQPIRNEIIEPVSPVPMHKKVMRIMGELVFYVVLIVVVLGVAMFGLQEPDASPRSLGGYSVMTVLSGSMRPTIPVRSLIVINSNVDPNDLEIDDIITHLLPNNTTVTHRIIGIEENYRGSGERWFRLQGDHNSIPDRDLVRAGNVIGLVIFHNLFLGQVVFFIQNNVILIVIFGVLIAALVYVLKKFFLIKREEESKFKMEEQKNENEEIHEPIIVTKQLVFEEESPRKKRNWKKPVKLVLLVSLLGLFAYSGYRVLAYQALYRDLEGASEALRNQYTQTVTVENEDEEARTTFPNRTFLAVDWGGLMERNQDVVAWIQVPGTNINYPVLAGVTNDEYLRLDLDRQHSVAGSIFLEENNFSDFNDLNTIVYGHNMLNGSKFAGVHEFITGHTRVEDVPYIYLYLPDGRILVYQIIGAHLTNIHSAIYHLPVTDLALFHELIAADNRLDVEFELDLEARILTLSTCAEAGASPVRSIIFGILIEERTMPQIL